MASDLQQPSQPLPCMCAQVHKHHEVPCSGVSLHKLNVDKCEIPEYKKANAWQNTANEAIPNQMVEPEAKDERQKKLQKHKQEY